MRVRCRSTQLASWSNTFFDKGSSLPLKNWVIWELMNVQAFLKPDFVSPSSLMHQQKDETDIKALLLTTCNRDHHIPLSSMEPCRRMTSWHDLGTPKTRPLLLFVKPRSKAFQMLQTSRKWGDVGLTMDGMTQISNLKGIGWLTSIKVAAICENGSWGRVARTSLSPMFIVSSILWR